MSEHLCSITMREYYTNPEQARSSLVVFETSKIFMNKVINSVYGLVKNILSYIKRQRVIIAFAYSQVHLFLLIFQLVYKCTNKFCITSWRSLILVSGKKAYFNFFAQLRPDPDCLFLDLVPLSHIYSSESSILLLFIQTCSLPITARIPDGCKTLRLRHKCEVRLKDTNVHGII